MVYSIINANPLNLLDHFNINSSTGDIILLRSLDREATAIITLSVTAQDQGVPGMIVGMLVQYSCRISCLKQDFYCMLLAVPCSLIPSF